MRRLWLLFAQAVTAGVVVFVLATLVAPERLSWRSAPSAPAPSAPAAIVARGDGAPSYAAAAAAAMPSVLNVYTLKAPPRRRLPFQFGEPEEPSGGGTALGSGVVMSADGYVLTNNHVIEGADAIAVALPEGKETRAKVIGTDPETDLAVLKISAKGLKPIALGDSDALRTGDVVLAIGNPFGVGQTVTQGIVSGTGRNRVGINTFENFIQTDAAINPGNSGGALVDAAGRLVGINTAILSQSGGSLGIGFAIPVKLAEEVMQQLVREGRVARGWLGIEAQDLSPELARELGVRAGRGAVLVRMLRGGPADRAGLQPGDVVTAISGKPVGDTRDLVDGTAAIKPGERGEFTVVREGRELKLAVEVGRRPPLRREAGQ